MDVKKSAKRLPLLSVGTIRARMQPGSQSLPRCSIITKKSQLASETSLSETIDNPPMARDGWRTCLAPFVTNSRRESSAESLLFLRSGRLLVHAVLHSGVAFGLHLLELVFLIRRQQLIKLVVNACLLNRELRLNLRFLRG